MYETTEHSIFENIIKESRTKALDFENKAKTPEVGRAPDTGGRSQKGRELRKTLRNAYETAEHSILEQIVSESREAALFSNNEAKAQEMARAPDTDDQKVEVSGVLRAKKRLYRKERAKEEREMTLARDDIEGASSYVEITAGSDEPEDGVLHLSVHEAASNPAEEELPPAVQTMHRDKIQRQKVNFFDVFPPSRVVSGIFEISAERSTLPRLEE